MTTTETRRPIHPDFARSMDTEALRKHFLIEDLFQPGNARLVYSHHDRMIVGGVEPSGSPVEISHVAETGTENLLDRREIGIACVRGSGEVSVGGENHAISDGDMLYVGMGAGPLTFSGDGARFYLISAPAHRTCPTRLLKIEDAAKVELGSPEGSNERIIYQFIHPDVLDTCQLVMGMTRLGKGSVWNTMPAHLHDRRSEIYLYRDLPEEHRVFHFMGEPRETRHLVVANHQAVISPSWSIHSGAGTASYTFIWAMAGDNVDYKDVEMVDIEGMR